jgi:hypothetical protein
VSSAAATLAQDRDEPLLSCLCVTEERAAFMPWLLWCYDRQTWRRKELVIIDSSYEPFEPSRPDVRVLRAPPGSGVMEKRVMALGEMRGDALAWFDDDDWQHPARLACLAEALGSGAQLAGASHTWLVDLLALRCVRHVEPRGLLLFNAAGYTAELALSPGSLERALARGSEAEWSHWLQGQAGAHVRLLAGPPLTALLCHVSNTVNLPSRWRCEDQLRSFRAEVGDAAWVDTSQQLEALRERLRNAPHATRRAYGVSQSQAGPTTRGRRRRAYRRR